MILILVMSCMFVQESLGEQLEDQRNFEDDEYEFRDEF